MMDGWMIDWQILQVKTHQDTSQTAWQPASRRWGLTGCRDSERRRPPPKWPQGATKPWWWCSTTPCLSGSAECCLPLKTTTLALVMIADLPFSPSLKGCSHLLRPHLSVKPIESHDGSKEEVGEVEVVFEQVAESEISVLLLAVF